MRPFSRDAQRYHQIGIIIAYRRVSTPSAGPHDWPAPSAAQAASGRQPPCAQSRHATLRRKTRHHRLCSAHMRHQSTISADDLIDPGTNFRPGTDRHHSGRRNLGRGSAGPAAAAKSLARHSDLPGSPLGTEGEKLLIPQSQSRDGDFHGFRGRQHHAANHRKFLSWSDLGVSHRRRGREADGGGA